MQGIKLSPPRTDLDSEEGKMNRERMLRAWVEIGAYLADFRRRFREWIRTALGHSFISY